MASGWKKFNLERLMLGGGRFTKAWLTSAKFLMVYPFVSPGKINDFAQGVLGLNDGINYADKQIPDRRVSDLFPGIEDVDITLGRLFPTEGSAINAYESLVLGGILKVEKAKRVFEIGTSHGVAAYNIAVNLPEDGHLFTLDLPPVKNRTDAVDTHFRVTNSDRKMIVSDRKGRRFLNTHVESRVTQLYGDSATFDYSPYDRTCDVVFVDGSHAYDYVVSDTNVAMKLVRPGGLILWHDYNDGYFWPDVAKYLHQFAVKQPVSRIRGTMFAIARVVQSAKIPERENTLSPLTVS